MKKNLGLRKSWWRWGCGSNKKDEQMDGHEVGIEIGLLEKALVQFTASIPLTLFVSTSGLKKEFKAKREIDLVFPCHGGGLVAKRQSRNLTPVLTQKTPLKQSVFFLLFLSKRGPKRHLICSENFYEVSSTNHHFPFSQHGI